MAEDKWQRYEWAAKGKGKGKGKQLKKIGNMDREAEKMTSRSSGNSASSKTSEYLLHPYRKVKAAVSKAPLKSKEILKK